MSPRLFLAALGLLPGCVSEEEQKRFDAQRDSTEATAKSMTEGLADDSCEVTKDVSKNSIATKTVACEEIPTQATFYCDAPGANFKTGSSTVSVYGRTGLRFSNMPYAAALFADPKVCGATVESVIESQSSEVDYSDYAAGP